MYHLINIKPWLVGLSRILQSVKKNCFPLHQVSFSGSVAALGVISGGSVLQLATKQMGVTPVEEQMLMMPGGTDESQKRGSIRKLCMARHIAFHFYWKLKAKKSELVSIEHLKECISRSQDVYNLGTLPKTVPKPFPDFPSGSFLVWMRVDTTEQIELQLQAHRPHLDKSHLARHTVTYCDILHPPVTGHGIGEFRAQDIPNANHGQENPRRWTCQVTELSETREQWKNYDWLRKKLWTTWNDNCFPLDSMDYSSPVWASLLTNRYKSTYHLLLEWDKVNRGQLTEMTLVAGELLSTDFSVAWLQLQSSRSQLTGLKTLNVLMTLHVLWCRHCISFKTSRMEATVLEDSLKREKQRDSENHWCGWVFLPQFTLDFDWFTYDVNLMKLPQATFHIFSDTPRMTWREFAILWADKSELCRRCIN